MLTLYVKTGCPYCERVLNYFEENPLPHELRNIQDDAVAAELIEQGGMRQVPFLIDSEQNVKLYESLDIIEYLKNTYPAVSHGPDAGQGGE
jgi:glutaredoxin